MAQFSSIGIIGKRGDDRAAETLRRLARLLVEQAGAGGVESVLVSDDNAAELDGDDALRGVEVVSRDVLAARCQLAIVVGGDGTLLSAARTLVSHNVPILGINHGRLGFLVEISPENIAAAIGAVFGGQYFIAERLVLSAQVRSANGSITPPMLAVNDVVVRNQASIRMIEFETWLSRDSDRPMTAEWEFICRHRADGLIAATPTGSTAYALSSGGPVLHPGLSAVALVPICPHTLTDRPIAVPSSRGIRIVQRSMGSQGATMTCDGQVGAPLSPGDSVEIHQAPWQLRLLHPQGYSYFRLLRDKLLWGRAPETHDWGG
ncbi:MAG: NAD(+)/NADH kinase [Sinobacteraceae bacterium]|nr:NAD(+)/NADH kinase [Nevskiaceae bacterium]